ncbi:hypothetical protein BX666DRAFT_1978964 [Dichotomocladium elegans]|nr:hypothetical protein BX666DRAFT_1978964 [Dichotomocladium elegans]
MSKNNSFPFIETRYKSTTDELQEPWKTLLAIAQQALRDHNYDESERITASVCSDLIKHMVCALDTSALTYLAKKKYAEASKVARQMKQVCPERIEGYLRTIDIHLAQYNTKHALEACESALRLFPPPSEEHTLMSRIKCEIHQDSLVDFVKILPLDLVEIIFGHFDVPYLLLNCAMVSKFWRRQLLQCSSLWRHISVIPRLQAAPTVSPTGIAAVGEYVRSIEAEDERGPWIASLCSCLSSQKFGHLDMLVLTGGTIQFAHICVNILFIMIETLTCFELHQV